MEEAPVASAPDEAAAPAVTKMVDEPVQDNPEPEQISNGNGHNSEEAAAPQEPEEKMDTSEPDQAEDASNAVTETEADAPKDAFDQMLSDDNKKEPDNFDKMLEENEDKSEAKEEVPEADEPSEEAKDEPSEESKPENDEETKDEPSEETKDDNDVKAESEESKEEKTDDSETKEDEEAKTEETKETGDEKEESVKSPKPFAADSDVKTDETMETDENAEKKDDETKEDKKEGDEVTDDKKDSFDKMLSGESEDKKDEDKKESEPATTINADALDETVTEEPAMDTEEPEMIAQITSDKIPSDEKFYEEFKAEDKEWLDTPENMPTVDSICQKLLCCISGKALDPVFGLKNSAVRHPHLGVPISREAAKFYGDGDWVSSEDGDEYCRFCGQGGDILLCDKCPNAFCKKCLTKNLGARALREITKAEEWACLVCDPKPIMHLKAIYYCLYKNQEEFKTRREEEIKKEKERQANRRARASGPTNKEKEDLLKSPKNFLEENISEAFKTLDVYQKSLETERTRCIKAVKDGMTADMATSITRKLRKLYAVTQKNMDLLDRAIVESFVENYPTESTRIHMGRVERNDPPTPRKAKTKQKIKIKPKKGKAGKGKVKAKGKKTIKLNGAPVYREASSVYMPSLTKKKRKKEDSDIECIDVSEEDDDYRPKKKFRPGPASSKKAKPGPASKKKAGPKSKTSYY